MLGLASQILKAVRRLREVYKVKTFLSQLVILSAGNHPCGLIKCRFLNSGDTAIKDYGRGFPFPLSMWVSKRMKIPT